MFSELTIINQFLYATLGVITAGGVFSVLGGNKIKPNKLANNEIKDYKEIDSGEDGMKISKNIQLKVKNDFDGICLVGPTGAGKTTSLFLNNLLSNEIEGSFIVTDPKGELFELTSGYQKKVCKREVYKIDFNNIDYSERYNLLEGCRNTEEVIQLASNLLMNGALAIELSSGKKAGGVEWVQMAEPLLAAVLIYAWKLERPFNNIEFALQLILNLDTGKIENLIEVNKNIDALTQFNIFKTVGGADRTEGSIKITLATNMKLFTSKDINKISNFTTFNIEKFREVPSVLYVIYPERKSSYLAPFIAPFFTQIIDKLLDNYNNTSLPIHLLFDEFGNIGMLNNMSINAATVRSRKISIVACLQSITQLYQVYGLNNAKAILNNLKTKILLPGISDIETINYISNLCGNTEINTKSESNNKENKSITYSKIKRKLFEDGELRTLEDNQALIIFNNKMPVLDMIEPYYENETINNVIKHINYRKFSFRYKNIKEEIERLKKLSINEQEQEDDNSRRILRQIFKEES